MAKDPFECIVDGRKALLAAKKHREEPPCPLEGRLIQLEARLGALEQALSSRHGQPPKPHMLWDTAARVLLLEQKVVTPQQAAPPCLHYRSPGGCIMVGQDWQPCSGNDSDCPSYEVEAAPPAQQPPLCTECGKRHWELHKPKQQPRDDPRSHHYDNPKREGLGVFKGARGTIEPTCNYDPEHPERWPAGWKPREGAGP